MRQKINIPHQEIIPAILQELPGWYRQQAGDRELPWRTSPTPYHTWLSEIMLQQTRATAVIPYYERFLEALPTIEALAHVDDERLMKLWQGLGYYNRARNLKKAAEIVMAQHNGMLPRKAEALKKLPGIGDYTAASIASIAYGESDCLAANPVWKTLQAKMKAGVTYYIFNVNGGIKIDKIQYQISAASAVDDGDNVTLTTTANMQGWRPFYDAYNSYTVDNNTNVYVVVEKDGEDAVKLANRTGEKVPVNCPVILHTNNVQEDGTYLITMTKDATPYEYGGNDNLLSASVPGTPVNAYRLGYRAGEGNGVAFYSWSADTPSAGIVYLDLSNSNTAKIELEIENSATGITSVRNNHNEEDFIFNINGQRLNAPKKGFNIINGKKVIVL